MQNLLTVVLLHLYLILLSGWLKVWKKQERGRMNSSSASGIWQGRWRLRLLGTSSRFRFYEYHLLESVHPDARPLGRARDTTVALGLLKIILLFSVI
uniref:Uncharacterized protein n=1 Tax=Nelumbo nucifera TaxID=4432 RepID=A0A822ZD41_NELNU|nr:TPA_asm: hypothetical protein HUJ06_000660 [Nelumbo nucifera]